MLIIEIGFAAAFLGYHASILKESSQKSKGINNSGFTFYLFSS